ncbi:MAG: penicillin acylase family protein, partial [Chitinophagaceae bacterium]
RKEYWFNNEWKAASFRLEKIKVRGKPDYLDTVAYTLFGPVMYDTSFYGGYKEKEWKQRTDKKYYAVRWKAHDASNELKMFTLLNRAKNYQDYYDASGYMQTPGQNCIFASKSNEIAIWQQGAFPAKWKYQGDFVMPGTDSSYMWQGVIPRNENPNLINPERGFVSSGNQFPVDASYPYYPGGHYPVYRGLLINRKLSAMNNITPEDMMKMQTDNYNVFAEYARPVILKNTREQELSLNEKKYFNILRSWDLRNDPASEGITVFHLAWDTLSHEILHDEFKRSSLPFLEPTDGAILENLLRDSAFSFIDDINTAQKESLPDIVTIAFKNAVKRLENEDALGRLQWAIIKETKANHLLSLDAFSRLNLPIGGGSNTINAANTKNGPSWRMVVHLTPETEAYGNYPGGQSGNPGSRFYDNFIDSWVEGKYFKLWMMKRGEEKDKRIKWKISFNKDS